MRRDTNLKDSLVRSNLQTDVNTEDDSFGTFPCRRRRCKTCAHTNPAVQINIPGGPLTVRQRFTCTTKNVVYIITCRTCTLSYIGETGPRLGDRYSGHLRSVTKQADLPVAKHFSSPGHTTDDMMVSVVNDRFENTKERRRAGGRLFFTCITLNTSGMNIEFNFRSARALARLLNEDHADSSITAFPLMKHQEIRNVWNCFLSF